MTAPLAVLEADLAAVLGPNNPHPGTWTTQAASVPEPQPWLAALGGASGWLMVTDAIFVLTSGQWRCVAGVDPGCDPTVRAVAERALEGEFALDGQTSVHLRRVGSELRSFTHREAVAGGTAVLIREHRHVSTERHPGLGRLRYRVAWRTEAEGTPEIAVLRPWVARFCGWEE